MIYNILEVANTHGGSIDYIIQLIDEFSHLEGNFGIKFQPYKYDLVATTDYEFFNLYKELFIEEDNWRLIIDKASFTKDVWLDIFDDYGIEILSQNLRQIKGIKFQASVLYNKEIFRQMSKIDLTDKVVIINVSGYSLENIKERVNQIESLLKPIEVWLEVGFQNYPTGLLDSGLVKIKELKSNFSNKIVFADHIDGKSEDAILLPIIASLLGTEVIEKHVMHSTLETMHDKYSSIKITEYNKYITMQRKYLELLEKDFICDKELEYLNKTIQRPILREEVEKGSIISQDKLVYKRTSKLGLNAIELFSKIENYNILSVNKSKDDVLLHEDFKKPIIATIIACRLKSKRLHRKALLPIGELSSIELCIKNALKFENVNFTVLATSTTDEDKELENYKYRDDVIFFRGDPDDVIKRYIDIAEKLNIDIIVRVTGDCPYISKDIFKYLLHSHFNKGADYTSGEGAALGTSVEIINVIALKKIKERLETNEYSEYMTWFFKNNPEYFRINNVALPEKWCRDYRLTLDYNQDLRMLNQIEKYFLENKIDYSIDEAYKFLDQNPDIARINSHIKQKYLIDNELIAILDKATKIKEK